MKLHTTDKLRNISIIGHGGEGKTSLVEAILFSAKITDRLGRVADGTATTDFDPEEIKRQISISAALAPVEWNGVKLNLIDVPGYFDFVGEMVGALKASDASVIVTGAVSGLNVGAEKAWDYCKKAGIPIAVFVNQMDRENANYLKILNRLKDKYGKSVVSFQLPITEGGQFKGLIDIVSKAAYSISGNELKKTNIPDALADLVDEMRTTLIEAAAETSEALMEKYFEGQEFTTEEINDALRQGVISGNIVPVLCGSAYTNTGITQLLDNLVNYLPSPKDRPPVSGKNLKTNLSETRAAEPSKPFSALVFKTVVDPFVGKLSIFKVMSGELSVGSTIYNSNKEKSEKAGSLYMLRGKKQIPIEKISAGDIGALSKLQHTVTGNTLSDMANPIVFEGIEFPKPSISLALQAEKEGEEEKVFGGLIRLTEEDPTFTVEHNVETGQMLISGIGEMHLEVLASRLKNKFGVTAAFKEPKVAFRETIRKPLRVEGKHKKQTGGHGQYGHVWIEFEPIPGSDSKFEFVDKVVGGVVPRQYIPAVEKGLHETIKKGVLAGYPVVGLRAALVDGSYHTVDSSEMAFKMAAYLAFKKLDKADPVLLEPIMHAEIIVPEDYMGDIIGDMNRRRGRILGMSPIGEGLHKVEGEVPQAEMTRYATDLRSMTQARGSFTLKFVRYEEIPPNISAKIVEAAKKEREAEQE
jgi:elongation factor G